MADQKPTGGGVFPTIYSIAHSSEWDTYEGMTLRAYFAGQALAGALAAGEADNALDYAIWCADQMIEKLNT